MPLVDPERVIVLTAEGKPLGADAMRAAIVRGGARRQWSVREDRPGEMTLVFSKQNKHEVVVRVSYDGDGFQIRYLSSFNMKYELDGGQAEIHPFYNKWVANLSQDISKEARSVR